MKVRHSTIGSSNFVSLAAKDTNRTTPGRSAEDFKIEQLRNMQEGLQRLQSMPSAKEISRQDSMNKVGWLRQRLDALKTMLLHASPEQAKALARELKNIAGELGSIAKSLGAGSSGQAARAEAQAVDVPPNGQASVGSAAEGVQPEAPVAEATSPKTVEGVGSSSATAPVSHGEYKSNGSVGTSGESVRQDSGANARPQEVDDAALRGLLLDAKKLLKQVVDMLKPKLAAAGKEAKADMRAIEERMSELDGALQRGSASNSYSDQGSLISDFGSLAVGGLNINLTA